MKLISDSATNRAQLRKLKPSKIAVAFIGKDWKRYIDASVLEEIIVWPKFPSNPKAIRELFDEIGIENVHFLDDLHSKIYISHSSAIVGSFNLSRNGFGEGGHFEAGVVISDSQTLNQIRTCYANYKRAAKQLYPNSSGKEARLTDLRNEWTLAYIEGRVANNSAIDTLMDYKIGEHRIHIAWWGADNTDFKTNEVTSQIYQDNPQFIGKQVGLEKYFRDTMRFLPSDDVRVGDWILGWQCNDDGMPRRNGTIEWIFVHHVVPDGVSFTNEEPDNYTTLVGESSYLGKPPSPFALTKEEKDAMREVFMSGRFPALISDDEDDWELGPADAVAPAFLKAVQKRLAQRGK